MTFAEVHVKRSVILTDCLGPEILLVLRVKGFLSYPVSVVKVGHHHDRIPFTLTFHPHNHTVKSIILNNFKLLQNDPETGRIFWQPPLISFKHDKNVGNFLVRSALKTHEQPGTFKCKRS